jgi:class 3 adenylate cyclase
MDLDKYSRRLAAILFTDMVGYTAVMQKDELKAIQMQKKHQRVVDQYVKQYGGEVKNDMGDGSMSILPSAYEVIRCAMAIQKELKQEPDRVNIRVGIHIADILEEENGKVHGDGINIASRIETLGVAGAILFSKEVYNKIKNHPEFKCALVGSFPFKNVEDPIEIYAIANDGYSIPSEAEALANGKLKKPIVAGEQVPSKPKQSFNWWYLLILPIGLAVFYFLNQKKSPEIIPPATPIIKDSMQHWKGQIVQSDLSPAPGVIIDINGGIARDTSDAMGHFEFILPKSYFNQQVDLSLFYKGKLNLSHKIRLNQEVLDQLKIEPDRK